MYVVYKTKTDIDDVIVALKVNSLIRIDLMAHAYIGNLVVHFKLKLEFLKK